MVTIEQLEKALNDDDKESYVTKNIDHMVRAIELLRERIPYKDCPSIIVSAEHDTMYLCDSMYVLPHLSEDDLIVLADCNVCLSDDQLYMFT